MDTKGNDLIFKKSSNGSISLLDTKIKGFGKSNIDLTDNNLIFKALDTNFNVKKSVNDIDYLIYSKGNFFFDDTIYIGINGEQFEITCKNNEIGLRQFYDNMINIKAGNPQRNTLLRKDETINTSMAFTNQDNQYLDNNTSNSENNSPSISEEIRNGYNLMKEGIITEEEFEQMKKELLKPK